MHSEHNIDVANMGFNNRHQGARKYAQEMNKRHSKKRNNWGLLSEMNSSSSIDNTVREVLSTCGGADEACDLKMQVFPEWRCERCSSPTCNGNMQDKIGLRDFVFVQNHLVADWESSGTSNLVARLNFFINYFFLIAISRERLGRS